MFCNACSLCICLQIHTFLHLVFTVDKSLKLLNILHNPIQLNAKHRESSSTGSIWFAMQVPYPATRFWKWHMRKLKTMTNQKARLRETSWCWEQIAAEPPQLPVSTGGWLAAEGVCSKDLAGLGENKVKASSLLWHWQNPATHQMH